MKNIRVFYLIFFQYLEMKFSIYLNRRVFVLAHFIQVIPIVAVNVHLCILQSRGQSDRSLCSA